MNELVKEVPSGLPQDGATAEQIAALEKYSIDGPFLEPVVRCDACQDLIIVEEMRKIGMCPHCNNTRMRNIRTLNEKDMATVTQWATEGKIDPLWTKLFAGVQ